MLFIFGGGEGGRIRGFWLCHDEIYLISSQGSETFYDPSYWQLLGSQFSIVPHCAMLQLAMTDPCSVPPENYVIHRPPPQHQAKNKMTGSLKLLQ